MKTAMIVGLLALLMAGCAAWPKVQDTTDSGDPIYVTSKGEETTEKYEAADGAPTSKPADELGVPNKLTKPKMVNDPDPAHDAVDTAVLATQAAGFGAVGGVVAQVGHFLIGLFLGKRKKAAKTA